MINVGATMHPLFQGIKMQYLIDVLITMVPWMRFAGFLVVAYFLTFAIAKFATSDFNFYLQKTRKVLTVVIPTVILVGLALSLMTGSNMPKYHPIDKEAQAKQFQRDAELNATVERREFVDRMKKPLETDEERQESFDKRMNWRD